MSNTRLKAVVLVLALPLIAVVFAPTVPAHVHAGGVLVPESWRAEHPGPHVISVTVALDEEWRDGMGASAGEVALEVVRRAAANLRPAGIDLRVAGLADWLTDESETPHPLLDDLESVYPAPSASLVVGLTGASFSSKTDGVARSRRPYVVVRHHRHDPGRDAYVLTHEIGHVFGLDHHTCPDGRCFMADHAYDLKEHWCPEHLELLKANGGYFHYLQDGALRV